MCWCSDYYGHTQWVHSRRHAKRQLRETINTWTRWTRACLNHLKSWKFAREEVALVLNAECRLRRSSPTFLKGLNINHINLLSAIVFRGSDPWVLHVNPSSVWHFLQVGVLGNLKHNVMICKTPTGGNLFEGKALFTWKIFNRGPLLYFSMVVKFYKFPSSVNGQQCLECPRSLVKSSQKRCPLHFKLYFNFTKVHLVKFCNHAKIRQATLVKLLLCETAFSMQNYFVWSAPVE